MHMSSRNITFRLYPTPTQVQKFERWLGLHCDLYNCALSHRKDAFEKHHVSISYRDQQNELPEIKNEMPELVELGSQALQETLRRVDRAFKAFFRRIKNGETPGFPRFKSRTRFDSFCYPGPAGWSIDTFSGKKGALRVGKLGAIKMRGKPRLPLSMGERRTLTISRKGDKWFATTCLRFSSEILSRKTFIQRESMGLDAGSRQLLYSSKGEIFENPKFLKGKLQSLKSAQRVLSKKKKGSSNRLKAKAQLSSVHRKIFEQRKDFAHKVTSELVYFNSFIAIEDLNLRNMTKTAKGTIENPGVNVKEKARFNRAMLDAGIGQLYQLLEYKAEEAGTRLEKVNPAGTSQNCASCNSVVNKDISVVEHHCPYCGFRAHRDLNGALNILKKGLEKCGLGQDEVWRDGVSLPLKQETASIALA